MSTAPRSVALYIPLLLLCWSCSRLSPDPRPDVIRDTAVAERDAGQTPDAAPDGAAEEVSAEVRDRWRSTTVSTFVSADPASLIARRPESADAWRLFLDTGPDPGALIAALPARGVSTKGLDRATYSASIIPTALALAADPSAPYRAQKVAYRALVRLAGRDPVARRAVTDVASADLRPMANALWETGPAEPLPCAPEEWATLAKHLRTRGASKRNRLYEADRALIRLGRHGLLPVEHVEAAIERSRTSKSSARPSFIERCRPSPRVEDRFALWRQAMKNADLDHAGETVVRSAQGAFDRFEPARSTWLDHRDPRVRLAVIRQVAASGRADRALVSALADATKDADPDVATAAIGALIAVAPTHPSLLPALIRTASEGPWPGYAWRELSASNALLPLLSHADSTVRAAASVHLMRRLSDPLPPEVARWLAGPEPSEKDWASATASSVEAQRLMARAIIRGAGPIPEPKQDRLWTALALLESDIPPARIAAAWPHVEAVLEDPSRSLVIPIAPSLKARPWIMRVGNRGLLDPKARTLAFHLGLAPDDAGDRWAIDYGLLARLRPLSPRFDRIMAAALRNRSSRKGALAALLRKDPPLGPETVAAVVEIADDAPKIREALWQTLADCLGARRLAHRWWKAPDEPRWTGMVGRLGRAPGVCPDVPVDDLTRGELSALLGLDPDDNGPSIAALRAMAAANTFPDLARLLDADEPLVAEWAARMLRREGMSGPLSAHAMLAPRGPLIRLAQSGGPRGRATALRGLLWARPGPDIAAAARDALASPVPDVVDAARDLVQLYEGDAVPDLPGTWWLDRGKQRPMASLLKSMPDALVVERLLHALDEAEARPPETRGTERILIEQQILTAERLDRVLDRPRLVARLLPWLALESLDSVVDALDRRDVIDPTVGEALADRAESILDDHRARPRPTGALFDALVSLVARSTPSRLESMMSGGTATRATLAGVSGWLLSTRPTLAARLAAEDDPAIRSAWAGGLIEPRAPSAPIRDWLLAEWTVDLPRAELRSRALALGHHGAGDEAALAVLFDPAIAAVAPEALRDQIFRAPGDILVALADKAPPFARTWILRRLAFAEPSEAARAVAARWFDDIDVSTLARVVALLHGDASVDPLELVPDLDALRPIATTSGPGDTPPWPPVTDALAKWVTPRSPDLDPVRVALVVQNTMGPLSEPLRAMVDTAGVRLVDVLMEHLDGARPASAAAALALDRLPVATEHRATVDGVLLAGMRGQGSAMRRSLARLVWARPVLSDAHLHALRGWQTCREASLPPLAETMVPRWLCPVRPD